MTPPSEKIWQNIFMLVSILSSINCCQGEKVEHGPKYSEPVWSKVPFEGDHEGITNIYVAANVQSQLMYTLAS